MVTFTEVNEAALLLVDGALSFATGVDVKLKRDGGGGEAKKLTSARDYSEIKANP